MMAFSVIMLCVLLCRYKLYGGKVLKTKALSSSEMLVFTFKSLTVLKFRSTMVSLTMCERRAPCVQKLALLNTLMIRKSFIIRCGAEISSLHHCWTSREPREALLILWIYLDQKCRNCAGRLRKVKLWCCQILVINTFSLGSAWFLLYGSYTKVLQDKD
jgi:hypothetical protein